MNAPIEISDLPSVCAKPITQLETCVRKNPGTTLLAAAGIGLVAVIIARALTQAPPRNRAVLLLEDIQHSLAELAHLGYDRASGLAEDGAHAVSKGVDSIGALHLDRKLDKFGRGIRNLFR